MVNVKVVCECGVVLTATRHKAIENWKLRRPGLIQTLPKAKSPYEVLSILKGIAIDYGGVRDSEVFRETDRGCESVRGVA